MKDIQRTGDQTEIRGFGCPICDRRYAPEYGHFDAPQFGNPVFPSDEEHQCQSHAPSAPVYMYLEDCDGTIRWTCPVVACANSKPFNLTGG